jgi:hypothetical protein
MALPLGRCDHQGTHGRCRDEISRPARQATHGNCGNLNRRLGRCEPWSEAPGPVRVCRNHERTVRYYPAQGKSSALGTDVESLDDFGVRPSVRHDEDIFDLLRNSKSVQGNRWFDSCGQSDPLLAVNERFVRQLRERRADVDLIETPGGHDWQSWNDGMPRLFTSAEQALR